MLQTEFGGKEGLFVRAFDAYITKAEQTVYLPISRGDLTSTVKTLQDLFDIKKNPMVCHGCFATNTLIEVSATSIEIDKRRVLFLEVMKKSFMSALKNTKNKGQLRKNFNIEKAASFLIVSLIGIFSLVRTGDKTTFSRSAWEHLVYQIKAWQESK